MEGQKGAIGMAFSAQQVDGLYQKTPGGVWYVRRGVPADVRDRLDGRAFFKQTTKTRDYKRAVQVRDDLWAKWEGEIAEARRLGTGPVANVSAVLAAVDDWRRGRCEAAARFAAGLEAERRSGEEEDVRRLLADVRSGPIAVSIDLNAIERGAQAPKPPLQADALAWARAYFASERGGDQERGVALPFVTGVLLGRLQEAARDPGGWVKVPGFDPALDAAVVAGGCLGGIPLRVREIVRQSFARAWLEVVQAQEHERQRAAVILATFEAATTSPAAVRVKGRPEREYVAREGDMSVGEVIDAFKAAKVAEDRAKPAGRAREPERLLEKQYGHIFKALKELIGAEKPIRSVTRTDVRDLRRLLFTLPKNASKLYKGVPLVEASELAARDGRPTLAQNTVRSYMIALKGVFTFARDEEWVDANPVDGLVPSKSDETKRAALTEEQLTKVFSALGEERRRDSAHWWVPAVLAFTGARANEICQLHVDDIKTTGDVSYIDLSTFDSSGNRLDRRRLKTEASERAIPIHSELKSAGFLEFVERRRAAGANQLFPELTENVLGYYSHEVSRVWGRHLDDCGLVDPALTLHSLRHGFKDAGDAVELPEYILEALGGWGSGGSAMRKYGGRCSPARVVENARHIERVRFGGFTLGPPPPLAA